MKQHTMTKLGTGIALSLVTSTMLHATNGDTLIAVGAKARGMGGTGIAVNHGAESTISNPAMITTVEGTEISFGGTIFMPTVETQFNNTAVPPMSGKAHTSDADMNMIPEVSIAHKINENWYIGIGMWGTAGMGTDYSQAGQTNGANNNMHMVTNLQLMQFAVPVAYKANGLSIAVAPIMQYGNLDINYKGTLINGANPPTQPAPANMMTIGAGAGLAQDFGFGWSAGASYALNNFTIGAVYKSSIEMEYDGQLSSATQPFVDLTIFPQAMGDTLEQPAELGVGVSYELGQHTIAFDWKKIKWSDAKGYKDFGWDDQDVYAVGYQFAQDNWAVRVGYNHASNPVKELAGTTPQGASLNFFNLLGFPATAEDHYTLGGTYEFTEQFSLDLAYVYAKSNKVTYDISAFQGYSQYNPNSITTDHKESSLSFQLTYNF